MADLKSPRLIFLKGWLFLLMAAVSGALLLLRDPRWQTAALLAICVWAACRFYYFAFYVIQHYVDDTYRFAGLTDFAGYLWRRRRAGRDLAEDPADAGQEKPES